MKPLLLAALLIFTAAAKGQITTGPQNARVSILAKTTFVYAYGVTAADSIAFSTWADENAQRDLVWYQGVNLGSGNWRGTIELSNHFQSTSKATPMTTQVYATVGGVQTLVGTISWSIEPVKITEV